MNEYPTRLIHTPMPVRWWTCKWKSLGQLGLSVLMIFVQYVHSLISLSGWTCFFRFSIFTVGETSRPVMPSQGERIDPCGVNGKARVMLCNCGWLILLFGLKAEEKLIITLKISQKNASSGSTCFWAVLERCICSFGAFTTCRLFRLPSGSLFRLHTVWCWGRLRWHVNSTENSSPEDDRTNVALPSSDLTVISPPGPNSGL